MLSIEYKGVLDYMGRLPGRNNFTWTPNRLEGVSDFIEL